MACVNCHKIRSAILHGRMAEAAGLSVAALREKIGLAEPVADNQISLDGAVEPDAVEAMVSTGKQSAKGK